MIAFWYALNIVLTVMFSTLRATGFKSEAFQAFAHLYVGMIFAICVVKKNDPLYWCLFATLIVVEIVFGVVPVIAKL